MNIQTTTRGTPWASTWDPAWAQRVEAAESKLDRRVCGARTLTGAPCTLKSDHPSGRCRYHGGTDEIGAPPGNQNARIHGLYARRLQRCGAHCPMWEHCPFAGEDVLALDPPQRPICAYESAEYERVLEELQGANRTAPPNKYDEIAEEMLRENPEWKDRIPSSATPAIPNANLHDIALLRVMVSRAAAALSVTPLTDTVTTESENYNLRAAKVHPALQAFLRIARELRALQAQHARDTERGANASDEPMPSLGEIVGPWFVQAEEAMKEKVAEDERREDYTRRLEWIARGHLGSNWREHDSIREFALPRAEPTPGAPLGDGPGQTPRTPPHEWPPASVLFGGGEKARPP